MTVAGAKVLEKFGFERVQGEPVFTRTVNVSSVEESLTLIVVPAPIGKASRFGETMLAAGTGYVGIHSGGETRFIEFRGLPDGIAWHLENGHLALTLPAIAQPLHFELSIGPVLAGSDPGYMRAHLQAQAGSFDLVPFLQPGPARYEVIESQAEMNVSEYGEFTVDELVPPRDNPWNSHLCEVDSQGRFLWGKSTPWPADNPGDLTDAHEITFTTACFSGYHQTAKIWRSSPRAFATRTA